MLLLLSRLVLSLGTGGLLNISSGMPGPQTAYSQREARIQVISLFYQAEKYVKLTHFNNMVHFFITFKCFCW